MYKTKMIIKKIILFSIFLAPTIALASSDSQYQMPDLSCYGEPKCGSFTINKKIIGELEVHYTAKAKDPFVFFVKTKSGNVVTINQNSIYILNEKHKANLPRFIILSDTNNDGMYNSVQYDVDNKGIIAKQVKDMDMDGAIDQIIDYKNKSNTLKINNTWYKTKYVTFNQHNRLEVKQKGKYCLVKINKFPYELEHCSKTPNNKINKDNLLSGQKAPTE